MTNSSRGYSDIEPSHCWHRKDVKLQAYPPGTLKIKICQISNICQKLKYKTRIQNTELRKLFYLPHNAFNISLSNVCNRKAGYLKVI